MNKILTLVAVCAVSGAISWVTTQAYITAYGFPFAILAIPIGGLIGYGLASLMTRIGWL